MAGILAELFDSIAAKAVAADRNTLTRLPVEDPRADVFVDNYGAITTIAHPPAIRAHNVDSIDDFCALAIRAAAAVKEGPWGGDPFIWHSRDRLELVINDADRRDRVVMPLTFTDRFTKLKVRDDHPKIAQRALLDLLRLDLRDAIPNVSDLVAKLRKCKFTTTDSAGADVNRGRENFDADVMREAAGLDGLAEELLASVQVYDRLELSLGSPGELGAVEAILCRLDVDLTDRVFLFAPFPGELDHAIDSAQKKIRAYLEAKTKDTGIPIVYGTV